MNLDRKLVPRNGEKMVVGAVARISGCASQKEVSLEDQVDNIKETFSEMWEGPVEYVVISTKGKGERLDRPELAEVEELLRSQTLDYLICEDFGRLVRGGEAAWLCGLAVDHGTRVISINDCIDTIDPEWEADVLAACSEHVGYNAHTSKRIKKKLMLRFKRNGGARAGLPYGYVLPEDGKTYFDVQKDPDPETEQTLRDGGELLAETLNYSAVAQMFNARNVPGGPSRRKENWDGAAIKRLYHNPILKGQPSRGSRKTEKQHQSGRRVSVRNPDGPTFIDCPHLKYFEPEEIDPLLARLKEEHAHFSRTHKGRKDSRRRVPRKQTRFPGQQGTCYYCGSHFVWGGNGMTQNLMCARSRESKCWNSVSFNGPLFVERILAAILDRLDCLQDFDAQFRDMVAQAERTNSVDTELAKVRREEENLQREHSNLLDAIAKYGADDRFDERIADVRRRQTILQGTRHRLEIAAHRRLTLPESPMVLRTMIEKSFSELATTSMEFNLLMQQIVPEFHVYNVRLCNGGSLLPRIQARLDLTGIAPDARLVEGLQQILTSIVTVDVFKLPQHVEIREDAVRLTAAGHKQRDACQLIDQKPKQPTLQKALALQQKMDELGLTSPYVFQKEPPENYKKLRRHKTEHFRFEPLAGFQPPELI
jgi:Recombinase.